MALENEKSACESMIGMLDSYQEFCKKADKFIEGYKKFYEEYKKNGKETKRVREV